MSARRLRNLSLVCSAAWAIASPLAGASLATHPTLTFFSSITEEPLARIEAESIGPRFVRHGPFQIPAPGIVIESPTLTLHEQPCTGDDWARLLQELGRWQHASSSIQLLLTLPDGRAFVFQRPPSVGSGMLSGLVNPLKSEDGERAAPRLLRITHDGQDHLHIDLRPLPSFALRIVPPSPAEPEPHPSEPLPSVPPTSSESVASP